MSDRWTGFEVKNSQVAAEIRKRGAPAHTRAVGDSTILYYENPDFQDESVSDFVDHAGEERVRGKVRVLHRNGPGAEIGSAIQTLAPTEARSPEIPAYSVAEEYENVSDAVDSSRSGSEDRSTYAVATDRAEERKASSETVESETKPAGEKRREFSFSELDARDKEDLEKLYEEEVGPLSELEGTGSNGNVLKKDLIEALRTDR